METQRIRIQAVPTSTPNAASPAVVTRPAQRAPHPEVASVLQEANDLLQLIRDEAIWRSLLISGIDPDAQTQLAQCLEAARRSYTRWRATRGDNRLATKQRDAALVRIRRIVGVIGKVGRSTFSTTDSLRLRFGSGVLDQATATDQHPKPAA